MGALGMDRFPAEPEALCTARAGVFDHHVRTQCELAHEIAIRLALEICDDPSLAGIQVVEQSAVLVLGERLPRGGPAPQGIAEERFDLHDVCTGVGEELAGVGPGDLSREFDDAKPCQGSTDGLCGQGGLPSFGCSQVTHSIRTPGSSGSPPWAQDSSAAIRVLPIRRRASIVELPI